MQVAGTSPDGSLVEIVEIADHPWFVAVQFHPEFKSQPTRPHPLFAGFRRRGGRTAQRLTPSGGGHEPADAGDQQRTSSEHVT